MILQGSVAAGIILKVRDFIEMKIFFEIYWPKKRNPRFLSELYML